MKNLGWYLFGGGLVLLVIYLLTRNGSSTFLGAPRNNTSIVDGIVGIAGSLGRAISGSSDHHVSLGFGDGATSTSPFTSVDYGGGDLSPEEERQAQALASEL